jgi:cyanophycin synthetase
LGVLTTSLFRRFRTFASSPRKLQKLRDTFRDLRWRVLTVRSRWTLAKFKGPIIAITGTKGKTTTTGLISRIFADAGYRVGTASSLGVHVSGACILRGGYGGADGPVLAYRGGGTDVLVLETAHGGIQRYGFGFPRCDVAIFTNITDGHVGELGIESLEEMLALKWKLASKVRPEGTLILNADDPLLASAVPPRTAKAVYVTIAEGRVPDRVRFGAPVYRYAAGMVVREAGGRSETLAEVSEAHLLLDGLVTYNAYNLLAAIAAVEAISPLLPVSRESLVKSLLTFGAAPEDNPGHFNLFHLPGGRVVLLAGSNRDSYRRDAEILARLRDRQSFPVGRIVGVITGIGTHSNAYMQDLAGIASSVCDEILIREPRPRYRRSRMPGEITSILAGAVQAGHSARNARVCDDSFDLVRDLALHAEEPGRLIAVFCAFAQEPVVGLCRRLADLDKRTREKAAGAGVRGQEFA